MPPVVPGPFRSHPPVRSHRITYRAHRATQCQLSFKRASSTQTHFGGETQGLDLTGPLGIIEVETKDVPAQWAMNNRSLGRP